MHLKRVSIKNFRSIKQADISFDPKCRILVGINESGKSNILRALSTISTEYSFSADDVRQPLPDEEPVTESFVRFIFALNKDDREKMLDASLQEFAAASANRPILNNGAADLSLIDFVNWIDEGLYTVDLINRKRSHTFWSLPKSWKVIDGWKKVQTPPASDYGIPHRGSSKDISSFRAIFEPDYQGIPPSFLGDIDTRYINKRVCDSIESMVQPVIPRVVNWRYEESNLLPPTVAMDAFIENPDGFAPLKSMFSLAGVSDPAQELRTAMSSGNTSVRNLLARVANHATRHFKSIWKEHKDVSFGLYPNGAHIDANIVEKNHWSLAQRSDGFKRFISFLLIISANARSKNLTNALLLIDEPDIGLHPSGVGLLRDELISLSASNFVCFSTHSVFMIDRENIGRHLIVEKTDETTKVETADVSNFVDEEVLYKALKFSVFDILKKENLLFEGWRDKKLFNVAISKLPNNAPAELKELKSKAKDLGLCHAVGVKSLKGIAATLELAGRDCLILSDDDRAAKEKQQEYLRERGYGRWLTYSDIQPDCDAETGEDFVTEAKFKEALLELKALHATLQGMPNIGESKRLANVKGWLAGQGITGDDAQARLNELKGLIFDSLKRQDVAEKYFSYLSELSKVV